MQSVTPRWKMTFLLLIGLIIAFPGNVLGHWSEVPIPNGSFELSPNGWEIPGWRLLGTAAVTSDRAHDGTFSVRIDDQSPTSTVRVQSLPIPADPNTLYAASAQVYIEEGVNVWVEVEFWDAQNRRIGAQRNVSHDIKEGYVGEWHRVAAQGLSPARTAAVSISVVSGGANVGVAYWDSARLHRFDGDPKDGAGELNPTMGWAPQFQREADWPARIPVKVDWADNQLQDSPVTFGVPFPKGALLSTDELRLVSSGNASSNDTPVPAQFDVTATWDGPDGPIRWVLVNTNVEKDKEYFLEFGDDITHGDGTTGESDRRLQLIETDDAFVIDTGSMRAVISKVEPTLLHEVSLGNEQIITPSLARAHIPVVIDNEGNEYVARGIDEGFKVEVVRSGPLELALRREGWYVDTAGTRFAQFVTYTYFYAGQSGIRHDHTLVVAFDTTKHQIRDIRLSVPLAVDGNAQAAFATDESPGGNLVQLPPGAAGSLLQESHDRWNLISSNQTPVVTGDRAGGWFGLGDARWGAFAGWRDFWQQYPAELEVRDGVMHLHLWPSRDVHALDFSPSAVMGGTYPGNQVFHANLYANGLDNHTQAYGLGKTHNVWIGFYTTDQRQHVADMTRSFINKPVLAIADPKWNADSEVLGRVSHEMREEFPDLESVLDAIMHRRYWLQEQLENYGWIHYGDMNYNLSRPRDPQRIAPVLWRQWASMFYGGPNVAPLMYLRSGRRDAWDFHRINTRHITDIDIAHLDSTTFRKRKGGRYGGDGGIVHYAAEMYDLSPDNHQRFMLYDYYVNGNLRAWEVANYYFENYLDLIDAPNNQSYQNRHTGGSLRLFTEAYEATWNPEYLKAMHQFATFLLGERASKGYTRYDDFYMNEGIIKYYQLTGDERMLELFLNNMRVHGEYRDKYDFDYNRHMTMSGLAHAYWFTGDETFLDTLFWQLKILLGPDSTGGRHLMPTTGDPALIGATGVGLEYAFHSTVGNQLPFVIKLVDELDIPLPYLLSQTEYQALLEEGDGQGSGMVVYAPDRFTPPSSYDPMRVYFRVPEGVLFPGIYVNVPVLLYDHAGELVSDETGVSGWISLSDAKPGVWSIEPITAVASYEVRPLNIPPFFALENKELYFEPDTCWVEWQAQLVSGKLVKGRLPLEFRLHGSDCTFIQSVQIILNDDVVFEGPKLPENMVIPLSHLEQGEYELYVVLTDHKGKQQRSRFEFAVQHVRLISPGFEWGQRVRGSIPLVFEFLVCFNEILDFSIALKTAALGQPESVHMVHEGAQKNIPFKTTEFEDGFYELEVRLTTDAGTSSGISHWIVIENWDVMEDSILPPFNNPWFGLQDRLKAADRSEGWEYATDRPNHYFNDDQRIRPNRRTDEFITWQSSNLRQFELVVYSKDPDVHDRIKILVSADGSHWVDIPFSITSEGPSAAGWFKLELKGSVADTVKADYFRFMHLGSVSKSDPVELGNVRLKSEKQ